MTGNVLDAQRFDLPKTIWKMLVNPTPSTTKDAIPTKLNQSTVHRVSKNKLHHTILKCRIYFEIKTPAGD